MSPALVAVAAVVSRVCGSQVGLLLVHPIRRCIARRVSLGPISASWAAVIISCHGGVLIRNPPGYVQSRPTMGDP